MKLCFNKGVTITVRPSGTEPKIKFYINSIIPAGDGTDKWFAEAKEKSTDFFDLTMEKATKIRTSILLIPY